MNIMCEQEEGWVIINTGPSVTNPEAGSSQPSQPIREKSYTLGRSYDTASGRVITLTTKNNKEDPNVAMTMSLEKIVAMEVSCRRGAEQVKIIPESSGYDITGNDSIIGGPPLITIQEEKTPTSPSALAQPVGFNLGTESLGAPLGTGGYGTMITTRTTTSTTGNSTMTSLKRERGSEVKLIPISVVDYDISGEVISGRLCSAGPRSAPMPGGTGLGSTGLVSVGTKPGPASPGLTLSRTLVLSQTRSQEEERVSLDLLEEPPAKTSPLTPISPFTPLSPCSPLLPPKSTLGGIHLSPAPPQGHLTTKTSPSLARLVGWMID